jgi:DNA-binding transcriptional LysR family regulator
MSLWEAFVLRCFETQSAAACADSEATMSRLRPRAAGSARTTPRPADERSVSKTGLTTLNRLRCFEVVVEEAGFTRATARLRMSRPALSYQMKHLEKELGAQLFERHPGGVRLTEEGRLLFRHARRVSDAVCAAERAVRELPTVADVRIGTVGSIATYFLPQLLSAVHKSHAATCAVELVGVSSAVVEALLANRLDLAVLADPQVDRRLRYETLFEEQVSLVSGRSHPFFGSPSVSVEQLREAQFVALATQTPTGSLIREHLDRLCVSAEPVASSENVETVKRMVEVGLGVAFLPDMVTERHVATQANPGGALTRHVVRPPLCRRIVLVTPGKVLSSPAIAEVVDQARRQSRMWIDGRPGARASGTAA